MCVFICFILDVHTIRQNRYSRKEVIYVEITYILDNVMTNKQLYIGLKQCVPRLFVGVSYPLCQRYIQSKRQLCFV